MVMAEETEATFKMFSDSEVQKIIITTPSYSSLLTIMNDLRPDVLDILYLNVKFQYECDNNTGASDYLYLPLSDKEGKDTHRQERIDNHSNKNSHPHYIFT
ncbi:hypothetical protein Pcinc_015330 [Petrolisthes cinctipes]|uniref:Uncharacterized protein n=1 Tax=Petrolisthes cinctipes TaxID=88211 RepID=A0AAE1FUK7_PETCI|nr:hypothetical protein Pcinc_015330 [Petrolisthes cinctipes]